MSEQKQIVEQDLKTKLSDRKSLSITRLDKLDDGWESDNYLGYPVPQVFLLETEHSPANRPFISMEYIQGQMMWKLIDVAQVDRQAQLIDVTDSRIDLAWTLVLTHAHARPGLRDEIFQGYQRHAGKPVEQIEVFEATACARRLLGLAVSLTQDAQRIGMNA